MSVDKGVGLRGKCRLNKSICRIAHFGIMKNESVIMDSYDIFTATRIEHDHIDYPFLSFFVRLFDVIRGGVPLP